MDQATRQPDLGHILSLVAAGDHGAFAVLYKRTAPKLYGSVALILGRGAAADDALQDTFTRIWKNAAAFDRSKGSPIAWMCAIARNRALDEIWRVRAAIVEVDEDFDIAGDDIDPVAARDRSEQYAALLRCLKFLAVDKRQMVLLAYYRGASREAISKRFHRPVPTIKTILRRSLAQLKDCLTA